jgi:TP901-1 family phage major tail protein
MATSGVFNGTDLILKFHSTDGSEVAVGHSTSASLSLSNDLPEATTKTSAGFAEHIAGVISGEISFEGLVAYNDSNNAIESADYLLGRTKVFWSFGTAETGDAVYNGAGFINNLEMSAEMESPVSFSGSITVTGAITKTTN